MTNYWIIQSCSKDLKLWVNEHKPQTAQDVVELTDGNFSCMVWPKANHSGNNNNSQNRLPQREQAMTKDFRLRSLVPVTPSPYAINT